MVGALRAAHKRGGLQQLEVLHLYNNQMGDETATALAALLEAGGMPKLKTLLLNSNRIARGRDGWRSPPPSGAGRCRRARRSTSLAIWAARPRCRRRRRSAGAWRSAGELAAHAVSLI